MTTLCLPETRPVTLNNAFPIVFDDHVYLDRVEAFLFEVDYPRHFSWGSWPKRMHWLLRLEAGASVGWAEALCPNHQLPTLPGDWQAALASLKGLTVQEAINHSEASRSQWPRGVMELVQAALIDLEGQLSGRTMLGVIGLPETRPVPAMFCILEKEPERVAERAQVALAKGLRTHVKLKLFGEVETDVSLIRAARSVLGDGTYLVGDANQGYANDDHLADSLRALAEAGLSGCEDPALLAPEDWVKLQDETSPLALIPDMILRPSWNRDIISGMGMVYNLHPGCLGSILETVTLARKIRAWGAQLMIGDNSLIGPACSFWQQVAIGAGASWVEALEKPDECRSVIECMRSRVTLLNAEGLCFLRKQDYRGTGLEMDEDRLRGLAQRVEVF